MNKHPETGKPYRAKVVDSPSTPIRAGTALAIILDARRHLAEAMHIMRQPDIWTRTNRSTRLAS